MRSLLIILTLIYSLMASAEVVEIAPWMARPVPPGFCDSNIEGGDTSPWPWGTETTFPWSSIRGTWVSLDDCDRVFSFKPRTVSAPLSGDPSKKTSIVEIKEYNEHCKTVASGRGYQGSDNVVRAIMNKVGTGKNFDLTVRRFSTGGLGTTFGAPALVVTVSPHGQWAKRKSFEMKKISEYTQGVCYDRP